MHASVRALLAGIVDYAGLFPPAKLPLDQAFPNYLRYRAGAENWMLGRFICPAARLGELTAFRQGILALPGPVVISALGQGGKDAKEFLDGVRADLSDIAALRRDLGGPIVVDVYECKIPPLDPQPLFALVGAAAFLMETAGPLEITPFYEPPSSQGEIVQRVIHTLAADRQSPEAARRQRCRPAGLKWRCGGLEVAAIPTPEQIAVALAAARDHRLPLKFTAGLHHPFRHVDAGLNVKMHGFVNLFIAGVLARVHFLSASQIQAIVEDENPDHYHFSQEGLGWNAWTASLEEITAARREGVTSFGSCSFDEPREDVRLLGNA